MKERAMKLSALGQSIWYDNIERGLIRTGEMARMIREDGVVGVTSNPSIFEKAIGGSSEYDEAFRTLVDGGADADAIYRALVLEDIQGAADLLRPAYDRTKGGDGYISIEVSPQLAHETAKTIEAAREWWKWVDRPNVMIKIPATPEGMPAIQQATADGISVNVTLIFTVGQYEDVASAYLAGLEERVAAGKPVDGIASVASFFVSRIDSKIDPRLPEDSGSRGLVAIANSKVAYEAYKRIFAGKRWEALHGAGARPQRMLWASTSTKNPAYRDVLYVEELIGPNTVNTVPPKTLDAFLDHGEAKATLEAGVADAHAVLNGLAGEGVDLAAAGEELLREGVASFAASFEKLMTCIAFRREAVLEGDPRKVRYALGDTLPDVEARLAKLAESNMAARIWARDPSVWRDDEEHRAVIENRLGWLEIVPPMREAIPELKKFAKSIVDGGYRHVLLLGMGGSSLCPEVLRETFGPKEGYLDLRVLDSTDPDAVEGATEGIDLDETLFLVASKSGTTTEVKAFYQYFAYRVHDHSRFIAVTDPGTILNKLAREERFRKTFVNPPDIGGRYSALSYFGLVPAALLGIDLEAYLDDALRMSHACGSCVQAEKNPGIRMGAVLGEAALAGRDKLTLLFSPEFAALGSWVEQLVAESTGKEGKGIVPVDGESLGTPDQYGEDRIFVYTRYANTRDTAQDAGVAALESAGHPVITIQVETLEDLAGEFFRWEMATAVAGAVLGIDPFDEPNVKESKDLTKELLDVFESQGTFPKEKPLVSRGGLELYGDDEWRDRCAGCSAREALQFHVGRAEEGDFLAVLAYLPSTPAIRAQIDAIRAALRARTNLPVTVGYGPRFLHSTGQLHKGGTNNGVFLQITTKDASDLAIPDWKFGFSTLKQAQARGDFQALTKHGRRVVRVHLDGDAKELLAGLEDRLKGDR